MKKNQKDRRPAGEMTGTTSIETEPTRDLCETILHVRDPRCWVSSLSYRSIVRVNVVAHLAMNPSRSRDIVDVSAPARNLRDVAKVIEGHPSVVRSRFVETAPGRMLGVVDTADCVACRACIDKGVMVLSANSSQGGGLEWTAIAPSPGRLKSLIADLQNKGCDVDVKRVSPFSGRTLVSGDVTARQREILSAAVSLGYFESPKRAKLSDLGRALGLSRETVRELLRQALRKVLLREI